MRIQSDHSRRLTIDFNKSIKLLSGFPGCGGIFTSRRGEITPPMEEGRYLKNMDCAWLIRLYGNLRVRIEFTFFRLEDERNCNTDFVEVNHCYLLLLG